eukprot:gene25581-34144_t
MLLREDSHIRFRDRVGVAVFAKKIMDDSPDVKFDKRSNLIWARKCEPNRVSSIFKECTSIATGNLKQILSNEMMKETLQLKTIDLAFWNTGLHDWIAAEGKFALWVRGERAPYPVNKLCDDSFRWVELAERPFLRAR